MQTRQLIINFTNNHQYIIREIKFTYHCHRIDGALPGVTVAGTLAAHCDVADAVEIAPELHLLEVVVRGRPIRGEPPHSLESESDEPRLGEIHQRPGGPLGSWPAIHEAYVNLENGRR